MYGILFCQLAFTSIIIAASLNVDALRGCEYGAGREAKGLTFSYESFCGDGENPEQKSKIAQLWIASAIGAIVCLLTLVCVPVGQEKDDEGGITKLGKPIHMVVPYNYTLLFIFTFFSSIVYSKISLAAQASNPGVVIEAASLTTAAVLGITIFAFTGFKETQGKKTISFIGPGLSAIGLIFGVTAFFVFAPNEKLGCEIDEGTGECKTGGMKLLYATIGVCLFALIMLFDTSSVIGGKSIMFELGPETYILGALQLYLEMINMFVLIMVILGEA